MIQFPYRQYKVRATSGTGFDLVYRPEVELRVLGPTGTYDLAALADTGADGTVIPFHLAPLLGVELRTDDQGTIRGIDGREVLIWYARVNLEIRTPGGGPRWNARVGFHPGARTVLGHAGFLDHFTAKFNGRAKTLTLTPNGTAPAPV